MALFRAFSTRRSQRGGGGYDKLLDETVGISDDLSYADHHHQHHHHHHHQQQQHHHHHHAAALKRVTSVPASMLFGSSSKKPGYETGFPGTNTNSANKPKQAKGKKDSGKNSHPLFSLFEGKWRKKKITANPDFSRYIEYLKEGGMLNKTTTNNTN